MITKDVHLNELTSSIDSIYIRPTLTKIIPRCASSTCSIVETNRWSQGTFININFTISAFVSSQKLKLLPCTIFGQIDKGLMTFASVVSNQIFTSSTIFARIALTFLDFNGTVDTCVTCLYNNSLNIAEQIE